MEIEFTVLGEPSAQMRHRTVSKGNFHSTYDPSAAIKKNFLLTVQNKAPKEPITSPIGLTVIFYMPRPKAHYCTGKKADMLKDTAPEYHTSRPDVDNFCKLIFDALNGIFWKDDCQICRLFSEKLYSESPRTYILIQTL